MKNRKLEADKEKLQQIISKSMKTIMIGAIASIEEKFGDLWNSDQLSDEHRKLYDVFMECRKDILDKGNNQIRNCKAMMDGYTVEYSGFSITLPVVRR